MPPFPVRAELVEAPPFSSDLERRTALRQAQGERFLEGGKKNGEAPMQSLICAMLGIEFPLLAFSHCRDVVVAVSKAGGMGVFGAAALPPERLEEELAWIDEHIGGKPYGVVLIVPNSFAGKGDAPSPGSAKVPESHLQFTADLLGKFDVDAAGLGDAVETRQSFGDNMHADGAAKLLEVAFRHPIGLDRKSTRLNSSSLMRISYAV